MDDGTQTLSLLLGHLAAGSSLQLSLMARYPVTPAFYRFTGCLALVLLGTVVVAFPLPHAPTRSLSQSPAPWQALSLLALAGAVWLLWSPWRGAGGRLFWPAGLLGIVSVAATGWAHGSHPQLVAVHFIVSSLVLGAALLGMILGHWYLTEPGLPIAPLRYLSWVFFGTLCLRGLLTAQRLAAVGWLGLDLWPVGLFAGIRIVVGLVMPGLLAGLILYCVRTRSTMSATGLLYLALIMVGAGEAVARYLLLAHALLL